jgi:hypothetical protein
LGNSTFLSEDVVGFLCSDLAKDEEESCLFASRLFLAFALPSLNRRFIKDAFSWDTTGEAGVCLVPMRRRPFIFILSTTFFSGLRTTSVLLFFFSLPTSPTSLSLFIKRINPSFALSRISFDQSGINGLFCGLSAFLSFTLPDISFTLADLSFILADFSRRATKGVPSFRSC